MRIVNPSFGLSAAAGAKVALKPVNWKTDAIALVSNSKPNARELLDGIRDQAQRLPARSTTSTSCRRTAPASRRPRT